MATFFFDQARHRQLWLLMRDKIESFMRARNISSFYDAEIAVDDLKAAQIKNGAMGIIKSVPLYYCWACQYGWNLIQAEDATALKRDRCVYCPLDSWGADKCFIKSQLGTGEEGLFHELCVAVEQKNYTLQVQLCETIANLPVKEGVEVGTDNTGESTDINATIRYLSVGETYTYPRVSATRKLPINVLVRTAERGYVDGAGLVTVAYKTNAIDIINETDESLEFIIIDSDNETVYGTAMTRDLPAGKMITMGRNDNLDYLPATVLVLDKTDGKSAGNYVDAMPYVTIAHGEDSYNIYNETDEALTLLILEQDVPVTNIKETLLSGAKKTLTRKDAFNKKLPTVLFQDLNSESKTYSMYIPALGNVDIIVANDTCTIQNDSTEGINLLIMNVQ